MEEREKLLYIELPNLINRIMKYESIPPVHMDSVKNIGEVIKKVSNTEVDSAIETIEKLI